MDRYTHAFAGDEAAAIAKMPDLDAPGADGLKATGTMDANPEDAVLALCLAQQGGF